MRNHRYLFLGLINLRRKVSRWRNIAYMLLLPAVILAACSSKEIQGSPTVDDLDNDLTPATKNASTNLSSSTPSDNSQTSTPQMLTNTAAELSLASRTSTLTSTASPTVTATILMTCPDPEGYTWSSVFSEDTAYIDNLFLLEDGNVLLSGALDAQDGAWVAKIDPEGNPIWQKIYSSSSAEMIPTDNGDFLLKFYESSIEINSDGEVVQSINKDNMLPNADGSNTIVDGNKAMRYTNMSTPLWSYEIEDSDSYGEPTSDGGVIYAYSGTYQDTSVYWQPTYTDIKVISIDANGIVRQRVYGQLMGLEFLDYLLTTNDGGALLVGTHYYEGLEVDSDIWLLKVNKSGGFSWQTTLRIAKKDEPIYGIYKLSQGYLLISGDMENLYLVKLSNNGAIAWQKEINSIRGRVNIDTATDTLDGGLILAGSTIEKTEVRFLARFDARGNLVWEKLIGFSNVDNTAKTSVKTILPLNDGNILLGGGTNLLGQGLSDSYGAWLANIKDEGELLGFLNIYPGKFSAISTLSTRPNTLPDNVVEAQRINVEEFKIQVQDTAFKPLPACLTVGATLPTPQALPTVVPSPTPTPNFLRDLYLTSTEYMRGDDVLTLQLRLLELGYKQVGEADGVFGKMTEQAVLSFQENNNLTVDGYVGPLTWNKLFSPSAQPNN